LGSVPGDNGVTVIVTVADAPLVRKTRSQVTNGDLATVFFISVLGQIQSASLAQQGAGQVSSGTPFCRINAAFHLATERRMYAVAKNSVVRPAQYEQAYQSEQVSYLAEAQQLVERGPHTFIVGTRYQSGEFDTMNDIDSGYKAKPAIDTPARERFTTTATMLTK